MNKTDQLVSVAGSWSAGVARWCGDFPWLDRTGNPLPGHSIQVQGLDLGMACEYPQPDAIPAYLDAVSDLRKPVIYVLVSSEDAPMKTGKLLPYFAQSMEGEWGSSKLVQTNYKSNSKAKAKDTLVEYKIQRNSQVIPVFWAKKWPDMTAPSLEFLYELACHVLDQKILFQRTPVIHCYMGLGRTGTLFVAMALVLESRKPAQERRTLQQIVLDVRLCRSPEMVQKGIQMQVLLELAWRLQVPVL